MDAFSGLEVVEVGFEDSSVFVFDEGEALVHFSLEAHVEDSVGFVEDEVLEVVHGERLGVLEMVEEAPGGADDDVQSFSDFCFFLFHGFSACQAA